MNAGLLHGSGMTNKDGLHREIWISRDRDAPHLFPPERDKGARPLHRLDLGKTMRIEAVGEAGHPLIQITQPEIVRDGRHHYQPEIDIRGLRLSQLETGTGSQLPPESKDNGLLPENKNSGLLRGSKNRGLHRGSRSNGPPQGSKNNGPPQENKETRETTEIGLHQEARETRNNGLHQEIKETRGSGLLQGIRDSGLHHYLHGTDLMNGTGIGTDKGGHPPRL